MYLHSNVLYVQDFWKDEDGKFYESLEREEDACEIIEGWATINTCQSANPGGDWG